LSASDLFGRQGCLFLAAKEVGELFLVLSIYIF